MPKIMLIDDDETMISLLKTLLEMDGFEVVSSSNWHDLATDIKNSAADLLLMDCILPETDGFSILDEMRKEKALPDLKIIMTSGMDMEYQAMAVGANAFLLKPYTPDTLYTLINQLLES